MANPREAEILILPLHGGSGASAPTTRGWADVARRRPSAEPGTGDALQRFNDAAADLDVFLSRTVGHIDTAAGAARAAVIAARTAFMAEWRRRRRATLVTVRGDHS
jgi:hypothetical protein